MAEWAFKTKLSYKGGGIVDGEQTIVVVNKLDAQTRIGHVSVPKGFVSDGASIPRFAWSIVGHPFSGYLAAAVVHDYLYRKGSVPLCSRKDADKVLRDLMRTLGYGWIKARTFYFAVRVAGWRSWKKKTL